jgi:hypothetical protein
VNVRSGLGGGVAEMDRRCGVNDWEMSEVQWVVSMFGAGLYHHRLKPRRCRKI